MKYTGYHGTCAKRSGSILEKGFHEAGHEEWLGRGVYFFGSDGAIDGFEEAKSWAVHVKRFKVWAIIKAIMEPFRPLDMVHNIKRRTLFDNVKEKSY